MDKTHHGPVIALFSAQLQQVFKLPERYPCNKPFFTIVDWYVYFGYSANYNTRGAFAIHFLICGDLLNCLRSPDTMVITTESGLNSLKIIFTMQFLPKITIFRCFDVSSVWPLQIFQVQAKISTARPVFPNYFFRFLWLWWFVKINFE